MHITYKKGEIANLKVEMRALEKDFYVCYPTIETRFDIVLVSPDGKCYKSQIKYAGHSPGNSSGSICLDLRKETRNNGKKKLYTSDEVDVILAYLPDLDKIIWIDSAVFDNKKSLTFRYCSPKNNQINNIRNINDFIW